MYILQEHDYLLELYELMINDLEAKRSKIVQRGRLTEYEDLTLDKIDSELRHWSNCIDTIYERAY